MGEFTYIKDCRHKEEDTLKELDDVVGCIVHDFANVLATISSIAQISVMEEDRQVVDNNLRTIHNLVMDCNYSLERIRNSIDGGIDRSKEYYCFDVVVEEAMEICKHKLENISQNGGKKIELIEDLGSKKTIYCNVHDLKHLVMNLVFNGMDAIEENGKIQVKTYSDEKFVNLEVVDDGIGIQGVDRERLFEPYYTTKGSKGTGLGLNIVQDILVKHNGTIEVESKFGAGSKFIVKIPIR